MKLALCLLVICAAQLTGCNGENASQEDHIEFLRELSEQFLITTDGMSVARMGSAGVSQYAKAIRERGIDSMEVYKLIAELQINVAYLLLLQQSWEYLEYAEKNVERLLAEHELLIWTVVIRDDNDVVSERYREAMMSILKKVDTPYAQITVARDMAKKGNSKTAIAKFISILVADAGAWDFVVYKAFDDIPEAEKFSLLLPYLDSKSVQGAYAAVVLSEKSEYRDKAIEYLNAMKESDDPQLGKAAKRALVDVEEPEPDE